LDPSALEQLAPESGALTRQRLAPQSGIEDGELASLMRLMEADVKAGCPAGRLYGESLSLALTTYVARRYSVGPETALGLKGRLSRCQLERVRDYIESHLGSDLRLSELARVAGLSPQHFAFAFRNSMGVTPHRYVLRRRVREAERLLAAKRMSVVDIALALGFASQSHFTAVFHRTLGMPPKRYQQER
jgi:AraC family transcriptional regulator